MVVTLERGVLSGKFGLFVITVLLGWSKQSSSFCAVCFCFVVYVLSTRMTSFVLLPEALLVVFNRLGDWLILSQTLDSNTVPYRCSNAAGLARDVCASGHG